MIRNAFSTNEGNASAFQGRARRTSDISLTDSLARAHRFLVSAGGPPARVYSATKASTLLLHESPGFFCRGRRPRASRAPSQTQYGFKRNRDRVPGRADFFAADHVIGNNPGHACEEANPCQYTRMAHRPVGRQSSSRIAAGDGEDRPIRPRRTAERR
jgi:hypothetical protein